VRKRHDEHRLARPQRLRRGADAALVNDRRGAGKDGGIRQIVPREDRRREMRRRRIFTQQEEGAASEALRRQRALGVEIFRRVNCGRAEREDDGRFAVGQERFHGRGQRG
jgi:hypothetical protein